MQRLFFISFNDNCPPSGYHHRIMVILMLALLLGLGLFVNLELAKTGAGKEMDERSLEHAHAINAARTEVDGRGLIEIFRWTGNLGYLETGHEYLRQELVVEHEIVGVGMVVYSQQNFLGESTVAGMVFRKFLAYKQVLRQGEHAVENVFVVRHSTLQRTFAKYPRAQHYGV